MPKIKVGLVQVNNEFSGQCYLPYSVGILQSYAQTNLDQPQNYEFMVPIYKRTSVASTVASLVEADIVGFSTYVWNFEISKAIATELKRQKPETVIVFGGPHVPDQMKQFTRIRKSAPELTDLRPKRIGITKKFHQDCPFVDMACHGEGETVFTTILQRMLVDGCRDKKDIPSISYTDPHGHFFQNFRAPRVFDLSKVPLPFAAGAFDQLLDRYPDQRWIAMWETDRGCPYQCTYCDWGGAVEDKIAQFDLDDVFKTIEWIASKKIPYHFLANANFGILKRDVAIARKFAEVKMHTGYPEGISVQNAKNPKDHTVEALEVLEKAGLNKATVMSIQSLNPATLKAVRRDNMEMDLYYSIQKRLAAQGVFTMSDMILGMPEETYDTFAAGVDHLIDQGQHNRIQFNNLSNMPNAEMGDPEYQEEYDMKLVKSRIINIHGKKLETLDGIDEWQELIVATNTMPPTAWVRTRVFSWMTGLLYFNKLLQLPMLVLHEVYGLSYREMIELFSDGQFEALASSREEFDTLREVHNLFTQAALNIQAGQEEFIHAEKYLDIFWPPEEYVFIELCRKEKLGRFYEEAERVLKAFLAEKGVITEPEHSLLIDALALNKHLIKLPFQTEDIKLTLHNNVWEFYRSIMLGQPIDLQRQSRTYLIDRTNEKWLSWEEWYEKMVWWCNRRGAYLYGIKSVEN
ncbi:MAG: radical SAM protein [bacterium]|nr:radical SAM protein [bacterium]